MSIDQHRGAPPVPPLVAYAVLTVAALVVPTVLADGSPWASDTAFAVALTDHPAAIRWQSLLTLAAAIPLAVLSAIVADRIRTLGLHVPGDSSHSSVDVARQSCWRSRDWCRWRSSRHRAIALSLQSDGTSR